MTINTQPKNIIFMVSDGMSPSMASAYREYSCRREDGFHDACIFNQYLIGQQSTHSDDEMETITDSGASSTAMACGVKTRNGYVGLDKEKERVTSALEMAKASGKKTGICVTAEITHATPAGFAAHIEDRMDFTGIADQYFDDRIDGEMKIDVMAGGGRSHFLRDDRNLVREFREAGYDIAFTHKDFKDAEGSRALGLFSERALPYALDRDYRTMPTLKEMVESSIEKLNQDNDKGFFLMVEGSQIDWGAHVNDIVTTLGEIEDYAEAFEAAIDFAKEDGETLVISTSDHATGGMTMGTNDVANWYPQYIQAMQFTPTFLARDIMLRRDIEDTLAALVGFKLSETEFNEIYAASRDYHLSREEVEKNVKEQLSELINRRSNTGWTTENHTGEDVNIYGYGPGSRLFQGWQDNTQLGQLLKQLAAGEEIDV